MRQRWWLSALFSIAWMVLANGCLHLPAGPAALSIAMTKKAEKKAEKDLKKVDQTLASSCVDKSAWLAYFRDPDGTLAPVRDTSDSEHDEDWLGLRFTNYEGPRIRLGVLSVFNRTAEIESSDGKEHLAVPAAGIQEMLTVALYNTKRFDVIEQKRIEEIKREQTRTDTMGLPELQQAYTATVYQSVPSKRTRTPAAEFSPPAVTNVGTVLGVQYLVYGSVYEWTPDRIKRSAAVGMPKLGKNEAEIAITVTLVDVATGRVLYMTIQRARLGASHLDLGGGESSEKTPDTSAIAAACTNKAAFEVARFLQNHKWKGTIVAKNGANLYVNSGQQSGMEPGQMLNVKKVVMTVVDPESHTILGEDTENLCPIKVNKVAPNFSMARVALQDCPGVDVGFRVEIKEKDQPKAQEHPECAAAEANFAR